MLRQLPEGFAALETFVEGWALPTSAARAARRNHSSDPERTAFFDAAKDLVVPAFDLLERKPLDALDTAEQRLLDLMLSFAHVSLAVEVQGNDDAAHARWRERMRITRTPADAVA
jgi:hypothetical protein